MAKRMPEGGRHDLQAESESRAINMVYGAAAAVHAYDSLSVRPESR
jgi:pyruvate/2-oxoacid:ferredoxin oxidoreductase alpha subunit